MESQERYLMCRLCLCKSLKTIDIFENIEYNDNTVATLITDMLKLQVLRTDRYSKFICLSCFTKLTDFDGFIKLCHNSIERYDTLFPKDEDAIGAGVNWIEIQGENSKTLEEDGRLDVNVDEVFIKAEPIDYEEANDYNKGSVINDEDMINVPSESISEDNPVSLYERDMRSRNESTEDKPTNVQPPSSGLANEIGFSCRICNRNYFNSAHLDLHLMQHVNSENLCCSICHQTYKRKHTLSNHLRKHQVEVLACEICKKEGFANKRSLWHHKKLHSEKRFPCDECSLSFHTKNTLVVHKRSHSGCRPYECSICLKKFAQFCSLRRHWRIHTGEKPYQCKVCQKKFTNSGNLKIHERIHTGERPYGCNLCPKRFNCSSRLKDHQLSHTGERRYGCAVCSKRFSCSSRLKDHQLSHSDMS